MSWEKVVPAIVSAILAALASGSLTNNFVGGEARELSGRLDAEIVAKAKANETCQEVLVEVTKNLVSQLNECEGE